MASSTPILSSPPFRMCMTGSFGSIGSLDFLVRFSQHLLFRLGSHQQLCSLAPAPQRSVWYHFVYSSLGKTVPLFRFMMAFACPALPLKSWGNADVSTVPERT